MDELSALEQRVAKKWVAAAAVRISDWPVPEWDIDMSPWVEAMKVPLPPGTPQFPREQWACYPAKRTVALMLADHALDMADAMTDEQWMQVCMVMQYGGKTRLS